VKVLIVGGGGREHALQWKLQREDPALELLAAPGNPGIIAAGARCLPIAATDLEALATLADREGVDITIVGPEAPLAAGIVDRFRREGKAIFGPTRAAAEIETSKSFAKELMVNAGVPTARATSHRDVDSARRAVRALGMPVVIKATGLAAGKGVVVCGTVPEADAAIGDMLGLGTLGEAGREVLVEEFMDGEELSLFAITDGVNVLPMIPAQDHKRLLDGDRGPNTGGMGAYAPVSIGDDATVEAVRSRILEPVVGALREQGRPFTGLLYAGLMITDDGPKVVEFNCRFGDPETQALLPLLGSSLLDPVAAVATGAGIATLGPLKWDRGASATTVVAVSGYPAAPRLGDAIELPSVEPGDVIFHAGTVRGADGVLRTAGGRVVACTATRGSVADASERSAELARLVRFDGAQFRSDIGRRETQRHARAS
jgi:phosphoribosylamine--glycine ligase